MGLREGSGLFGKGLTTDCLVCHGGAILGKSYIGLGNASLDVQSLFEDLALASGLPGKLPFTFSQVRGTSEAGTMAVYLLARREPDLSLRLVPHDFPLRDEQCEDVPAWWHLKKKKTMYHTGTTDARSVRSIMQFMLASTHGPSVFNRDEVAFNDIRAYLLTLEAPKYPFAIDRDLARRGAELFVDTCARCHGTYGPVWTYPNKVVPLDVIGTDRKRFDGIAAEVGDFYNRSWFAQEKGDGYKVVEPNGYQAPPLDGIWATAPYLHNGSVPTLYNVLNSKTRPKIFTRTYRTDADAYDTLKVGWKVQVLDHGAPAAATPHEQRKIYDTTLPGRGNAGHTFGDKLSDAERRAVIEYLKTL
jgi:mono/diheme cytochrome c family protein